MVLTLVIVPAWCEGGQTVTPTVEGQTPALETDSDPTRPVFFSIRPEFYSIADGIAQRALIARYDSVALPTRRPAHGLPGVILRLELPMTGTDVGAAHANGVGDAYAQAFVVPWAYPKRHFMLAVGSGVVVPTATDDLLGGGKFVLAPVVAPLWKWPGGMFFVKVQNFTSVAGDSRRPDLNYLLITPLFVHAVREQWWVLVDSETKTAWTADGRTGVKSGLQIGRRVGPGVGFWIKPEAWWGPNRGGRWNLKFGLVWYQRRAAQSESAD